MIDGINQNGDSVVTLEGVTKIYKLYDKPTDRLKEALNLSKHKRYYRDFYALKDVSFTAKKGETLGLIGRNGSGKSTLLKIITGVLTPTFGEVRINGRISALLELGAGFNPEYTGIENIFLNGTILGFTKEQIEKKLDQILSFADIGDFVYQPVKLYSSGMFVRLAFAVQACIEPEILIVDEALAVGDAKFSAKCINHMKRLVDDGVTVLFVTHDVHLVKSFCQKVVWLNQGEVKLQGDPLLVTKGYTKHLFEGDKNDEGQEEINEISISIDNIVEEDIDESDKLLINCDNWGSKQLEIIGVSLRNGLGKQTEIINWGENVQVSFSVKVSQDVVSENIGFGFSFRNKNGLDVIVSTTIEEGLKYGPFNKGESIQVVFSFENILAEGDYLLTLQVEDRSEKIPKYYHFVENALLVKVFSEKHIYSLVLPKVKQEIKICESVR
ncbi:ABC transporter ATP-binding protein [Paenibacillus sp. MZ04-78.2]|uniref:ABC transporter ATP-binding protein n=1 Tax=Paenibacillus sp. MZ04-78.2 TaxID=2962034 RepID=UPI0020B7F41A|nr:ABC transporter ATP-binding protein [Paenibacillus sp. MZ04-78.2]MCP3774582.1 ABC transporter ATP-binding protein [Paenibacillus sp. MZ04-78.2]